MNKFWYQSLASLLLKTKIRVARQNGGTKSLSKKSIIYWTKNISSQWPKKCLIRQTRNISSHWPNQRSNQKHVLLMNMSSNWVGKKKMFATLWQDMTIVTSHVQKLDLIDKKSHRVILKSLFLRIHYYYNKRLQVNESQYLIPTYSWTQGRSQDLELGGQKYKPKKKKKNWNSK